MLRRFVFIFAGVLMFAFVLPSLAPAANFPERDITLVCPWAAGGGTDTLARTLAKNAKKYAKKAELPKESQALHRVN